MRLTIDDVRSRFIKHFDGTTGSVYASPGRINLIGEHTDYNNGYVFPGAVEQGIIAEIKPNGTRKVRAYSIDLKDYTEFSLDDEQGPKASWARYIFGVCREMMALGVPVEGFNTAFAGDVPLGAGMSSSAALESTFAFGLNDLWGENKIDRMELARVGQRTEHKYIGVMCGIMDQAISCLGRKGSLLRLDCRSGEYEYFPWNPKGYQLVLVNSCVKHTLAGSPYNERRLQCEHVAEIRGEGEGGVGGVGDAGVEMLEEVKGEITGDEYKRARYVIGEVERVLAVCDALKNDDYEMVGKMMYETHYGLSKEYEVSCEELDFLNDVAKEAGVTGSRIMGGGFGGCTINLVAEELVDNFKKLAKEKFAEKYGKEPIIIDVVIGDGARKLC